MKINTTATVLGMTRFTADNGDKFATVFTQEDEAVNDNNKLGVIATENKCDYDLMDHCRNFTFPAVFHIEGKMVAGSKKKSTLFISFLKPANETKPAPAKP